SDGDPATVTVPDPLPHFLQNELDPDYIASRGPSLVVYPVDDTSAPATWAEGTEVTTIEDAVRLRAKPSTSGEIVTELPNGTRLTIVSGPMDADDFTWWKATTQDGITGWIVEDFVDARHARE